MLKERYFQRLLKSDSGFALATTLAAVLLVTAIGTASYFVARNSLGQAQRSSATNQAYQVAVSALEYELSRPDLKYELGKLEDGADPIIFDAELPGTKEPYVATIKRVGSDISVSVSASEGGFTELVRKDFQMNKLSDSVYSGGGDIFEGNQLNGKGSMLIGKIYLKKDGEIHANSNVQFVDGPLYLEGGKLKLTGAVGNQITPDTYKIYSDYPAYHIKNLPAEIQVEDLGSRKMNPPDINKELIESLKVAASSSGYYFGESGKKYEIGTKGDQFNKEGNNVFKASGVIFCEGKITIPKNIVGYEGNFTIFARDGITVEGLMVPKGFPEKNFERLRGQDVDVILPEASEAYCATLISPVSIFLNGGKKNDPSSFAFCGAAISQNTVTFQNSVRGSIIGLEGVAPGHKVILASQDLEIFLHELVKQILNTFEPGNWTRKSKAL